jgi:hypothetical protein
MKEAISMKKKIIILKILLIPALLVGCSGQTGLRITANESTVIQTLDSQVATDSILQEVTSKTDLEAAAPYDELFLANFSEAIQTRWKLTNDTEDGSELTFEEEVKIRKLLVDSESEILNDCRTEKFEDTLLQEYAISYLNGLERQSQLIEDAVNGNLTEEKFGEEWDKSLLKRAKQICALYDNYDLKVDSKYNFQLNSLHNIVYIDEYGDDAFWNMLNDFTDEDIESTYEGDGNECIKIRCTNKTKYEFKDLYVYCDILDTKGTDDYSDDEDVEEIEYVIGDWKPGEETIMTFKRTTEYEENNFIILYV